jgi:hypothetical protein
VSSGISDGKLSSFSLSSGISDGKYSSLVSFVVSAADDSSSVTGESEVEDSDCSDFSSTAVCFVGFLLPPVLIGLLPPVLIGLLPPVLIGLLPPVLIGLYGLPAVCGLPLVGL